MIDKTYTPGIPPAEILLAAMVPDRADELRLGHTSIWLAGTLPYA